jgi:hypothetical protein
MNQPLKHARRTLTIPQPNGDTMIRTEGYYEELNSVKEEVQQSVKTSKDSFIGDLMKAVAVVTKRESRELTLKIEADDAGNPIRIVKTWTIRKEYYGR